MATLTRVATSYRTHIPAASCPVGGSRTTGGRDRCGGLRAGRGRALAERLGVADTRGGAPARPLRRPVARPTHCVDPPRPTRSRSSARCGTTCAGGWGCRRGRTSPWSQSPSCGWSRRTRGTGGRVFVSTPAHGGGAGLPLGAVGGAARLHHARTVEGPAEVGATGGMVEGRGEAAEGVSIYQIEADCGGLADRSAIHHQHGELSHAVALEVRLFLLSAGAEVHILQLVGQAELFEHPDHGGGAGVGGGEEGEVHLRS